MFGGLQVVTQAVGATYFFVNEISPITESTNLPHMEYSDFKALQALLFFVIPLVWGVWQLIVLRRDAQSEKGESK